MADITPEVSLAGRVTPEVSIGGKVTVPEVVYLQGLQGEKGDPGPKGDTGSQGEKGEKGDAFTYADFTEEQLAALKGPKGDTGAKGDKGDRGPQGEQGNQGEQGTPGADGHTPVITAEKSGKVTTIKVDGVVVATVSDGVVSTVNGQSPDASGNVALTGASIPMSASDDTTLPAAIGAKLSSAAGAVGTDNLGDGVVTAEKIAAGAVQMPTQGLNAVADLADDDSFPFYASSAGANKRTLWSNIVTKLKSLFLPLTGGTMTGNVLVERNSVAYVKVLNSITGTACSLYATDDSNTGLLMEHAGKWLIRYDGANVHINEKQYHPITAGTAAPSGGSDGDIYLKYT